MNLSFTEKLLLAAPWIELLVEIFRKFSLEVFVDR